MAAGIMVTQWARVSLQWRHNERDGVSNHLSGPSHANEKDRKPAHKIDISATIV